MVNRAMNCVTVYTKDSTGQFTVPVKAMTCSVGREGHDTPLGTYVTSDQFIWAVMADYTRAQYVYRFKGPYLSTLFHIYQPQRTLWKQRSSTNWAILLP